MRLGPALLLLALFVLAIAARAVSYRTVVRERVHLFGNDAFYHLRRIVYAIADFPASLEFDRYLNHPEGAKPIWTPVFDWGVAALVRPFAGPDSLERLERIVIWVPPLLGGLAVLALYWLSRRYFGRATAALAALILAVLPGHVYWSQLAFVDHHALVSLLSLLLVAAAMGLLAASSAPPSAQSRRGVLAVATGAAMAGALLVWPGSLLDVALVELALLVFLATRSDTGEAQRFALSFALAQATAFLLVLPLGASASWPQWSAYSPVVLSRFQPWLFATLGVCGFAWCWAWRHERFAATRRRRIASAAAAVALVGLANLPLRAALWQGAGDAWRWLSRGESFQGQVSESLPLFSDEAGFGLAMATANLSWFVLVLPLAAGALALSMRRRPERAPVWLLLGWLAGVFAATLMQRRFMSVLSAPLALLLAWCIVRAWDDLARRPRQRVWRNAARAAVAALALLLMAPTAQRYRNDLQNLLRVFGDGSFSRTPLADRQRTMMQMAEWIRENTPETSGWLERRREPEYGVLGSWEIGHVLTYTARRPVVADNFGDDLGGEGFPLARRYFLADEQEGSALLERLGVRYVVAQGNPSFLDAEPQPLSLFVSLFYFDGTQQREGLEDAGRAPLERHRLVYESRSWPRAEDPPLFKVFEHVAGARVAGRAAPGAQIEATLSLRTNRGRHFVYRARARADQQGRYVLRLPYATQGQPAAVEAAQAYAVQCGGDVVALVIPEQALHLEIEVQGPDLCL